MALFPCDVGSHRYYGAQQTIYPAFLDGATAYRSKLRLCPSHFDALRGVMNRRMEQVQDGQLVGSTSCCLICGQDTDSTALAVFATIYAKGGAREDLFGTCHLDCLPEARDKWAVVPTMSQKGP